MRAAKGRIIAGVHFLWVSHAMVQIRVLIRSEPDACVAGVYTCVRFLSSCDCQGMRDCVRRNVSTMVL